jgi:hypothetical protein
VLRRLEGFLAAGPRPLKIELRGGRMTKKNSLDIQERIYPLRACEM